MDIILRKARLGFHQPPCMVSGVQGGGRMDKKVLWLIIIFTVLFIIGVNTGELGYLMNLGNTI
jgi:hypothetical protein